MSASRTLAFALSISVASACATAPPPPNDDVAPTAAVALGRLLAPLATPEVSNDLVGSSAWPGAQVREERGVVQVDFGRPAELKCGFRGRFTLTRHRDAGWRVNIDELNDGRLRYWGKAEVRPESHGLMLRLDLVVLEGTRGAELVVSGRIRRVEGRWHLEAEGTWNDGTQQVPVRVAKGLQPSPRLTRPRSPPPRTDRSFL